MKGSTRAFFGAALFWLTCAALLHVLVVAGVSGAWATMVHVLLFGWISSMIIAVNYHTMPVFAARDFPSQRMIWAHWLALATGLLLTTAGLLLIIPMLVVAGLLLECGAALLFYFNIVQLLRRGTPRARAATPPIAHQQQIDRLGTLATKASGVCLPLALGILLGARLGWAGEWALAAEHLTALGWIMLMIVGVGYHVLPRFTGKGVRGVGWAQAQLGCHLSALLIMIPALGFGWSRLFALGGVLMAVAIGLFAWTVWPTVQAFRPRRGDLPRAQEASAMSTLSLRCIKAAFVCLALGLILGVSFAVQRVLGARLRPLHVELNIWGGITLLIYGFAYHMLPRFTGRPLNHPRLATAQSVLAIGGVALAALGWVASATQLPYALLLSATGTLIQLAAVLLFGWHIGRLLIQR